MRDKVRHCSDLSQINCDDHFFVGQEESWDDLDFTGSSDHAVDPSLWERVKLLVLSAIIIINYWINNQLSFFINYCLWKRVELLVLSAIIMINYSIDNQLLSIINYCLCNGSNCLSSLQGRWDGDCEVTRLSTMNVPLLLPAHEFGFQEVSASSIVFELPLNSVKHKSLQEASASQLTLSKKQHQVILKHLVQLHRQIRSLEVEGN